MPKFGFLTKFRIFRQNLDFWLNLELFCQNLDFWLKFRFLTEISIFDGSDFPYFKNFSAKNITVQIPWNTVESHDTPWHAMTWNTRYSTKIQNRSHDMTLTCHNGGNHGIPCHMECDSEHWLETLNQNSKSELENQTRNRNSQKVAI